MICLLKPLPMAVKPSPPVVEETPFLARLELWPSSVSQERRFSILARGCDVRWTAAAAADDFTALVVADEAFHTLIRLLTMTCCWASWKAYTRIHQIMALRNRDERICRRSQATTRPLCRSHRRDAAS
jgi:hypothetical protein